jgi:hypothetical protein
MASRRNEIIIAVIGLIGVVFTAVISNWDKMASAASIPSNSAVMSNDINVQLRYFIEISGFRASLEALERQRAERYKVEYKADNDTVNCMLDMSIQTNQLVDIAVNALKNHFTLEEIKELNRINSSPAMANFAAKQPAVSLDLIKGLEDAMERAHRRNLALAGRNKSKAPQGSACPAR